MLNDLLDRAKKGDRIAEEKLFEYLIVRFKAFATRSIGEEHAEDVAIDACEVVLKKYRDMEFSVGFDAWAYGVVKNVIRNFIRNQQTEKKILIPDPEIDGRTESSTPSDQELRITLIDCMRKILEVYPRYALVLNMTYEGYQTDEICEALDIKPNNVYVILNRGRAVLKRCLETGRL